MRARMSMADAARLLEADGACGRVTCVNAAGQACEAGSLDARALTDVTFDSRAVRPGALFICKGAAFKQEYARAAAQAGATGYLAGHPCPASGLSGIIVEDVRRAMALVACAFFSNPSQNMSVIAITGTKGKTTTAFYIDAILQAREHGAPHALLTGLVIDDGLTRVPSHNTTPESVELQRHLAAAVDVGCDIAVMEASSQGLKYDRTLGSRFAVGMFTNIGEDHISPVEHPTFEDYFSSKLRIFSQSSLGIVNLGCNYCERVLAEARDRCQAVLTYDAGLARGDAPQTGADIALVGLSHEGLGRWDLVVDTPTGVLSPSLRALGAFNVSNAVAAIAACEAVGVGHDAIEKGLADVRVPGRMELYATPDASLFGVVDYAHNGMSMRALLQAAREEFPGREVTVVFGSCGTRALDRRAGLGHAAGELADRIILTEDEPDTVDVRAICDEIGAAVRQSGGAYEVEPIREEAIARAVRETRRPGVVVVAGKGAETTMLRAGRDEPYGPDARILCRELGIPYDASRDARPGR